MDYRELWNGNQYRKILEIGHEEIMLFLTRNLRPRNFAMQFFYAFNGILIFFFFASVWVDMHRASFSFWAGLMTFLAGIPGFLIVVIPMHEMLHALVFLLLGARNIRIVPKIEKMMVYVVADKFVMNFRDFIFLALTPFVLVNTVLIILLFMVSGAWKYAIWSAILFHATGCIGDFALLGFLSRNNPAATFNYDDFQEQKTYFFERIV